MNLTLGNKLQWYFHQNTIVIFKDMYLKIALQKAICPCVNTLGPRQNGHHFADDIFKCIFLNENILIIIKISLKFVLEGPVNNIPALVKIMAWRCPGAKPLFEQMMVSLLTYICVTRPQWVNKMLASLPGSQPFYGIIQNGNFVPF